MTMATNGSVAPPLAAARKSLDSACADLDEAVQALPDLPGDNVMANPGLVALLLRVVVARRHLSGLELRLRGGEHGPRMSFGASVVEPAMRCNVFVHGE
jgi:hypothetical protein